jgi:hypothetical protein
MMKRPQRQLLFSLIVPLLSIPVLHAQPERIIPYPPSRVILDVVFDWTTQARHADGSDNWAVTWAADDHQYTSWGDGGGFNSVNGEGRVSLGVARIEGHWDAYTGINIWGGFEAANPALFSGKSYGILALGESLHMWVSPGSGVENYKEARLAMSTDHGATWTKTNWAFSQQEALILPTILQFGRDYAGARDNYVYHYAVRLREASVRRIQQPGAIDLMRVPQDRLLERSAYEFFAGIDSSANPIWTPNIEERVPVFEDANGVGWTVSVSYNPGLDRYFLITEHRETYSANMGIFDAPEPWGPWTTVEYYDNWGGTEETFFWNFSTKWLSEDGREFTLIYTGTGDQDSWNTVRGRFITPGS